MIDVTIYKKDRDDIEFTFDCKVSAPLSLWDRIRGAYMILRGKQYKWTHTLFADMIYEKQNRRELRAFLDRIDEQEDKEVIHFSYLPYFISAYPTVKIPKDWWK